LLGQPGLCSAINFQSFWWHSFLQRLSVYKRFFREAYFTYLFFEEEIYLRTCFAGESYFESNVELKQGGFLNLFLDKIMSNNEMSYFLGITANFH
jgi:hypothetical protein